MKQNDVIIKSNLRMYRKIAGLTQQQLANEVGCSLYMIQLIESNKCIPNLKLVYALCSTIEDYVGYAVRPTLIFDFISYYYSN